MAFQKYLDLQQSYETKEIDKITDILRLKNKHEIQGINITHTIYQDLDEFSRNQKENTAFGEHQIKKNIIEPTKKLKNPLGKMSSFQLKLDDIKKATKKNKSPSKKKAKEIFKSSLKNSNFKNKSLYDILYLVAKPFSYQKIQSYELALKNYEKLIALLGKDPWVLIQLGRCYSEILNHEKAVKYYEQAYKIDPSRIEGTEYYSSCLFNLKK